jgi:hypothetical protein
MDIRDLRFWFTGAQKKLVQDQMKRIVAARLAMVDTTHYEKAMSELEGQIRDLKFGKDELVQDNWEDLKRKRRG